MAKPFNCPINRCTKSFNQHGHLPKHVQSCQLKCNCKENEKPVHPPSSVTSCSSGSLTDADTERPQFHIKILLLSILTPRRPPFYVSKPTPMECSKRIYSTNYYALGKSTNYISYTT
ncbi:unnamed protein product [Rhizophagus irregularis]|nr:unnamed protein product [Rhizophagus irregularis]CAB5370768.1 unnamed protein product [Rhizophagus irregularis]